MSQSPGAHRDPTDPLSGLLLGIYDGVGEMMLGLAAGPVELGRQATPMLTRFESGQRSNPNGNTKPLTSADVLGAPQAAGKVALETGKGLGRIVTASLKTPVLTMNGLTRGFHNLPKAWGEDVREYENVTGIKSGLKVSAKVCLTAHEGAQTLMICRVSGTGLVMVFWISWRSHIKELRKMVQSVLSRAWRKASVICVRSLLQVSLQSLKTSVIC